MKQKKDGETPKMKTTHILAFIILAAAIAYYGFGAQAETPNTTGYTNTPNTETPTTVKPNTDSATADTVKIPVSEITTQLTKQTLQYGGKTIKYLTVMGIDGVPRVAFDACEVCGGAKGYRQSGTDVICNNCGRHFQIDDLGAKNTGGGCWPAYLPYTIEDGQVIIKKTDIQKGGRFF